MTESKPWSRPNETRFVCKLCSRTFRRVEHLRRHETSHTGTRPYVCPNCKATFFRGDVLVRHLRNVHKIIAPSTKLRSVSHVPSNPDGTTPAAGTIASNLVHPGNPNHEINAGDGAGSAADAQGLANLASQPLNLHQNHYIYGQAPSQYVTPQPFVKNAFSSPSNFTPLAVQQESPRNSVVYYTQGQQQNPHPVRNEIPPIPLMHPLLGHSNPPMQNLIAYGYGPYPPDAQNWTDQNSLHVHSTAADHDPSEEDKDLEGLEQGLVVHAQLDGNDQSLKDSIDVKSSSTSTGIDSETSSYPTSYGSDSSGGATKPPPLGPKSSTTNRTIDRPQEFDFFPTSYSVGNANELHPFLDLYDFEIAQGTTPRKEVESKKADTLSFDSHLDSILKVSFPPQQSSSEESFTFETPRQSNEALSWIFENDLTPLDSSVMNDPSTSSLVTPEETCSACGRPFKTLEGNTHDFSFNLIGSKTDFKEITDLIIGPAELLAPSVMQLDRYLAYYACFCHPIIPLIHQSTFDPTTAQPALLFAICAIGAELLQEPMMARILHFNADRLLALDWKKFNSSPEPIMDIDTWIYFMQASYFIEWQSLASSASSNIFNVSFAMRDLQLKLMLNMPEFSFLPNVESHTPESWAQEQRVVRIFAGLLAMDAFLVCSYNFDRQCHKILQQCKEMPLPCSELLWNTSFESEASWRQHLQHETFANKEVSNPQNFGELLCSISVLDLAKLKRETQSWRLNPTCALVFVGFATTECEVKEVGLNHNKDLLRIVWQQLRDFTPSMGQCAILNPRDDPSRRAFLPLTKEFTPGLQLIPSWERIWQNQHPLIAIANLITVPLQWGVLSGLKELTQSVRSFSPSKISEELLRAMNINKHLDMTAFLPCIGIIMDLVRFGLVIGLKGMHRFRALYSFSFVRSIAMVLGHRPMTYFCCWAYAIELKIRTGQPVGEKNMLAIMIVLKSCLDYNIPGITPFPTTSSPLTTAKQESGPSVEQTGAKVEKLAQNMMGPVKLSVTAGIARLLGSFGIELAESTPGACFYKALINISSYLDQNMISPK